MIEWMNKWIVTLLRLRMDFLSARAKTIASVFCLLEQKRRILISQATSWWYKLRDWDGWTVDDPRAHLRWASWDFTQFPKACFFRLLTHFFFFSTLLLALTHRRELRLRLGELLQKGRLHKERQPQLVSERQGVSQPEEHAVVGCAGCQRAPRE